MAATARMLLLVASVLAPAAQAAARPAVLSPAHSGVWYDPSRSGEGYVIELIGADRATLTWFTYDDQGNQRWLAGAGSVVRSDSQGTYLDFPEVYETSGGIFGEGFDPARVERTLVGTVRVEFEDCSSGRLSYSAYGTSGSVPIQRIANTMGLGCAPVHGSPGDTFAPYAGHGGSWFDPSHSGEGFQLQWTTANQALLTWYSYDTEGRQYWMTGVGTRQEDGRVEFPSLVATRGGRFGASFDPDAVERFHWGNLTLQLDCSAGTATYQSSIEEFVPGSQALRRLTGLLGVSCPYERPALTDLYDVQLTLVPTEVETGYWLPQYTQVLSIADDGTLLGAIPLNGQFRLYRRVPGGDAWEALTEDYSLEGTPFQISADASTILVNVDSELGEESAPLLWTQDVGFTPLSDTVFDASYARAGSHQLTHVVGTGRPIGDVMQYPWIWSEATGQVALPRTDEIRLAHPLGVAEDGSIVIGFSAEPDSRGQMATAGIRWRGSQPPEYLVDAHGVKLGAASTCRPDCRVVYGSGQADYHPDHPSRSQPWVMLEDGSVQYIEHIEDAFLLFSTGAPYGLRATSADGSIAVGSYVHVDGQGQLEEQAFLWTRLTGPIPLRHLMFPLDESTGRWHETHAMDVTSDGSSVLVVGVERIETPGPGPGRAAFRSAILTLAPRVMPQAGD